MQSKTTSEWHFLGTRLLVRIQIGTTLIERNLAILNKIACAFNCFSDLEFHFILKIHIHQYKNRYS